METLVLFGGVWWVWNYTTWATTWIDPDRLPVRVLMVVLMGLSLVMSTAIPEAFGERGLQFAIAVVAMQVIRPLFMVITLRDDRIGRNYRHLGAWSAAAGVLWIAGAFTEGHVRLAIWALALAVDVAGPQFNYWVPGLGSTPMSSWRLSPGHLVERYRLIVIIALGETVLALGREFTEVPVSTTAYVTLAIGFLISVALWWGYFARHADQSEHRLVDVDDAVARARGGYAYAPAILVAGIIVAAVGSELMVAHPHEHSSWATALAAVGGVAIFVVGLVFFVRATGGGDRFEVVMAATALVALGVIGLIAVATEAPLVVVSALVLIPLYGLVAAALYHEKSTTPAR